MRCAVLCLFLAAAAGAPSMAVAQSIVDWSKPQTGLSHFVFNADLTPARLGEGEERPAPVAARIPACGENCRMQQPELPKQPAPAAHSREGGPSRSGTRVYVIAAGGNGDKTTQAQPNAAPRKTFRFRRR